MYQLLRRSVSRQQSTAWLLIFLALGTYVAGFLTFFPGALIVADEADYVAQAETFAHGHVYMRVPEAFSPQNKLILPSTYPPGTALLQSVFVRIGGWRSARFASLLCLIATVLLLAKWLAQENRPVGFALLFLLYPPVLVLGRVGMSDICSGAIVLFALWLFWTANDQPWLWFAASAAAGASLLFREANVLVFIPLFGLAILRRERGWPALILGTITGVSCRLVVFHFVFGRAFFYRRAAYGFSLHAIGENLWLYLFALIVMLPGGLLFAFAYRGRCRWPTIAAVILYLLFYLSYNYNAVESGHAKQLILGPRFFIPLLPLLIFSMAESAPRLWHKWTETSRALNVKQLQRPAAIVFSVVVLALAFGVHPAMARFSRAQSSITRVIYSATPNGAPLLTNPTETSKFISSVYGNRILVDYGRTSSADMNRLRQLHGPAYIVLLERTESEFFRKAMAADSQFLARTRQYCPLKVVHDQWHDARNRLLIWEVGQCATTTP